MNSGAACLESQLLLKEGVLLDELMDLLRLLRPVNGPGGLGQRLLQHADAHCRLRQSCS
jgi:hypothetical protein